MREYPINILVLVILGTLVLTGACFADQSPTAYNQRFAPVPDSPGLMKFLQNSSHLPGGIIQEKKGFTPVIPQIPDSVPVLLSVSSANRSALTSTRFRIVPANKNTGYQQAFVKPVLPGGPRKVSPGNGTVTDVVDANNRFASELYTQLDKNPVNSGKNVFFSPFSISTVLALAYEGARGTTADQIQAVFHYPTDNNTRRSEYATLIASLNDGNSGYTLRAANALWAEKTYRFLPEFAGIAQNYYDAKTINLDFVRQPEISRNTINKWVEDKTNDKIKDLLPAGSITPDTKLVITNAVYFKGTWVKQFAKDETKDDKFFISPGNSADVRMMQRTDEDATFNYAETGGIQVLEMPYTHSSGKELSMIIILPGLNTSLAATESTLSGSGLSDLKSSLRPQRVRVYFPKFRMETDYSLSGDLTEMGMPDAFSNDADFSGMDGTRNLVISDIVHKAYIDVNEEGTEAAAATGGVFTSKSIFPEQPVPVFRADHPFIFFIQDRDTGAVLFIGRLMNPAGQSGS
jgi:serpin B